MKVKRIFPKEDNYFFGYYGISPWSKDSKKVLGTKVPFLGKHPTTKDELEIFIKDLKTDRLKKIAKTKTWSWQQGCMLQWIGPDFNTKIIFNDFKKGNFISRILDTKTKKEKKIDFPIYAVLPSGKRALSVNFSRLNDLRKGYGYSTIRDSKENENIPKDDGIYLIDLEKNKSKLIISLKDLCNLNPLDSMNKGKHWFDHIEVSPNGKRFSFFHRFEIGNGLFHTRLISSNLEGKDLFLFPDSGFYSHVKWKNDEELFGYASISEKLANVRSGGNLYNFFIKILRPFYKTIIPKKIRRNALPIDYWVLKDKQKKEKHVRLNLEKEDGHATFSQDGKYIITDTYPDKKHFKKLILYDVEKKKKKILARFYSIPKEESSKIDWDNGPFRCDLHPRWSFKGDKISIDSVHEGKRNMYEIDNFK